MLLRRAFGISMHVTSDVLSRDTRVATAWNGRLHERA